MRIRRRYVALLALATAAALATVGLAVAAPDGNHSSVTGSKFSPSTLPKTTFKAGSLFVHTHTDYGHPPANQTDRAFLYFDNDGKLNTTGVPTCAKANIQGQIDMAAAMAACKNALIGLGTATAQAGPNTIHACVLAFNGSGTGGHVLLFTRANSAPPFTISCTNPGSNHNGNTTVLLDGVYSANPTSLGADFTGGKQLLFSNITQNSPFPLTDFNVTVGVPKVANAGNYVSARCHDSNHQWNLKTTFTYVSPAGTQVVNAAKTCS